MVSSYSGKCESVPGLSELHKKLSKFQYGKRCTCSISFTVCTNNAHSSWI